MSSTGASNRTFSTQLGDGETNWTVLYRGQRRFDLLAISRAHAGRSANRDQQGYLYYRAVPNGFFVHWKLAMRFLNEALNVCRHKTNPQLE